MTESTEKHADDHFPPPPSGFRCCETAFVEMLVKEDEVVAK